MRARLTLLAAGVVAAALLVGGPLWVWGVRYRMLDDLRERDRSLAVMTALVRIRVAGPIGFGSFEIHRPLGLPSLTRGSSLVIQMDSPPRIDPFPSADLLLLTPDGHVEFTGGEEGPPPALVGWLESVRGSPSHRAAASDMGELAAGLVGTLRDCVGAPDPLGDLGSRLPDLLPECTEVVDDARVKAARRAARLGWPQRIASAPDGGRLLQTAVLVRLPEDEMPWAVSVTSSLASIDATIGALVRSLLFGGPLLLALVASVAWYLVGRSLRVVGDLQREMEQIAFGTLDRRLEEPRTKDEVARLVVTLNRMLDRLADGARRQREFIGDASHELRSPIASIRTQLEVALSHPGATDWPRVAGGANAEVIRMQKLVDNLLRIARLDESRGASPYPSQEVDLDDVVRSESAALRDTKVGLSGVSPARVWGIEQDLRRIVRNLLENAERYGGGRIEVSLSRKGSRARLEIEDDGPGIPPEQRALVFERFTRLEESRSRAGGGAGLGLSLARGLVEAHGGEIWIEEARIGGARLVVSLPVDPNTTPDSLRARALPRTARSA
jgi:signal transduction histidine kinase